MEEIILGIKVDTSGSQIPIAELESSLKKMKDDIKTLPSDSQAFKVLQSEIRKADAELKNVNKSLEGLSKEKLSESLGKVAGGATAAVASFGLLTQAFGATKESAEQMQQSLNIAFGVVTGVKGLIEAFTGLSALMPVVTQAMAGFNAVLKANPIGLSITAITLLTGAFIAYNATTEEATIKQENFNTSLEAANKTADSYLSKIKEITKQIDGLNTLLVTSGDLSKNTSGLISDVLANLLKGNKELFNAFSGEVDDAENKIKDALQKRVSELAKISGDSSAQVEKLQSKLSFLYDILFNQTPDERKSVLSKLGKSFSELRTEYEKTGEQITELLNSNNQVNVSEDEIVIQLTNQLKQIQELKKNGLKTDQERNAELEKQKKKQQEIQDEFLKFEFIRRENAIRSAQEGIDIVERRDVELLKREEQYQNDLLALKRNENLSVKQKTEAGLVLEKQYALDKLDINQKYLDEKKAQEEKAAADKKAREEAEIAEHKDLTKRYLLATKELNLLTAQADKNNKAGILKAQQEFLDAQMRAELSNTNITEAEKDVIRAKYAQKQKDLIDANAKYEKEKQAALITELSSALNSFYQVYSNLREGDNELFAKQQEKQLNTFTDSQDAQLQAFITSQEEAKLTKEQIDVNVAAEEKRLAAEREQFLADQENEAKKRKKEAAKVDLAIQAVTSVATLASAIIKAQQNQFPLNIEETVRIVALGATQIAAITAQVNKINEIDTYRRGGVINGPSHENGGVKFAVGGQVNELEGGEGVINKRSMSMPGVAAAASYLNQLGGGVAFNTNALTSTNNSSVAVLSGIIKDTMNDMTIRAYVVEKDITDTQRLNNRIRNNAKI